MRFTAALFLLIVATQPSAAGTICGTVRNGETSQPIPGAEVRLFNSQNLYTGLSTETGQSGFYCLSDVPDGTYTVQVRVDGYVSTFVPNVVVDDATSVDIDTTPRLYLAEPAPNPATSNVAFRIIAPRDGRVVLEVFDVRGRLVKGWTGDASGTHTVYWDLHDARGVEIATGVYMVRIHSGSSQFVRRFVCVR